MESVVFKYKMLGVVTLYNPNIHEAVANIRRYVATIDCLIIWDNSSLVEDVKHQMHRLLQDVWQKVVWHGTGENMCIAPAINYSLHYALEHDYDMLLVMDQDSQWEDFPAYRRDVEDIVSNGEKKVLTPYVKGCDDFEITHDEQERHFMINSGTVIPVKILAEIGEVDEKAFPLDALDHDISYRVREHGYSISCLTYHVLNHSLGQWQRMGVFNIMTPNYNWRRTYSMTRSHIICYRKHKKMLTDEDRHYLYWEILIMKFARIMLAEPDKFRRMKAFVKGILDGLTYKK
jgi:GT2 family glycosyltransferase